MKQSFFQKSRGSAYSSTTRSSSQSKHGKSSYLSKISSQKPDNFCQQDMNSTQPSLLSTRRTSCATTSGPSLPKRQNFASTSTGAISLKKMPPGKDKQLISQKVLGVAGAEKENQWAGTSLQRHMRQFSHANNSVLESKESSRSRLGENTKSMLSDIGENKVEEEGIEAGKKLVGVRVCCRIKPEESQPEVPGRDSRDNFAIEEVDTVNNTLHIRKDRFDHQKFHFDSIYDRASSQQELFNDFGKKTVHDFVTKGVNGSLFAYGQTGSGKTYSMFGGEQAESRGLIYRSLAHAFELIDQVNPQETKITLKMQFFQIYMDSILDMLPCSSSSGYTIQSQFVQLQIREDPFYGVVFSGTQGGGPPQMVAVDSYDSARQLIEASCQSRIVNATRMNDQSSRSHSVLLLLCEKQNLQEFNEYGYKTSLSKLYFVDLAGSERVKRSKVDGHVLAETNSINLSLTTLGKCVRALGQAEGSQQQFLPFRDSKLTHALKEVFSTSVNLNILINVSSDPLSSGETISSLQFSTNCKKITNKVFMPTPTFTHKKNSEMRESAALIQEQAVDIQAKNKEIASLKDQSQRLREENSSLQEALTQKSSELQQLKVSSEQDLLKSKQEQEQMKECHLKQMNKLYEMNAQKVSQMEKQFQQRERDLAKKCEEQVQAMRAEFEENLKAIMQQQSVNDQSMSSLAILQNSTYQTDAELLEDKKKLEEEVRSLKSQLQVERDNVSRHQREVGFLQFELKLKQNQINILKNTIDCTPSPAPNNEDESLKVSESNCQQQLSQDQQCQQFTTGGPPPAARRSREMEEEEEEDGMMMYANSENDDYEYRRDSQLVIFKSVSLGNLGDISQFQRERYEKSKILEMSEECSPEQDSSTAREHFQEQAADNSLINALHGSNPMLCSNDPQQFLSKEERPINFDKGTFANQSLQEYDSVVQQKRIQEQYSNFLYTFTASQVCDTQRQAEKESDVHVQSFHTTEDDHGTMTLQQLSQNLDAKFQEVGSEGEEMKKFKLNLLENDSQGEDNFKTHQDFQLKKLENTKQLNDFISNFNSSRAQKQQSAMPDYVNPFK